MLQDQQRNINSVRLANKTTIQINATMLEFGLFTHQRHVDHPIFRYLDYYVSDYGGFASATDDRMIAGFRNRLVAGVNALAGTFDYKEYENLCCAVKGALLRSEWWRPQNYSAYAENSFFVLPNVALVVGGQFLHAVRDRQDRFLSDGDQSISRSWDIFSPKVGVLWDVDLPGRCSATFRAAPRCRPSTRPRSPPSPDVVAERRRPDGDHLRDRHARPATRYHLGHLALPHGHQQRAAMPDGRRRSVSAPW